MRRILFLAWVEVLHVVRDRASLAQVLLIPFIQLVVLANAATFTIRDTPMAVVDLDRSTASRRLISRFAASPHFQVAGVRSAAEAEEALLAGDVTMVLTLPHDLERRLVRGEPAQVQVQLNAEKGSAAGIVQGYAERIIGTVGAVGTVQAVGIQVSARGWYNDGLDYRQYMVPGILVALVTLVGTLLTAQNIAREKELGTLEQLNVTPITRGEFITAKLLPFWVLAMVELALGLVIGALVFDMPMRGSVPLVLAAGAVYLVVALGLGLLISTMVDTQQQAMFVTFFMMMIYLLMSGLYTPVDSMPGWVRVIAEANPLKHFVALTRAVLMKGAGPAEVARPMLVLTLFAVVVFSTAVWRYRKTE